MVAFCVADDHHEMMLCQHRYESESIVAHFVLISKCSKGVKGVNHHFLSRLSIFMFAKHSQDYIFRRSNKSFSFQVSSVSKNGKSQRVEKSV